MNHNSDIKKIPPHSMEAEQAVLASAMIDEQVIDELFSLNRDDFYFPNHRYIYDALEGLNKDGKPLDLVTLASRLKDEGNIDKAGGFSYISELVQIIPNSANMEGYCRIVRERALLRRLVSAGGEISELGYNLIEPVDDLIDRAQAIAYNLSEDEGRNDVEHIESVLFRSYERLERLYENSKGEGKISGVPSAYHDLDEFTNGFQPSDLIILAGRPGMGKTAFALNIMYNAAAAGKSCVFFTMEMSPEQLANRLISFRAKITAGKLRTGALKSSEWQDLGKITSELQKLSVYIDGTPSITVNQIRARCRKLNSRLKNGLDMVFIDYLQIMGSNKNISVREQQISEISRSLKALAKELNIPVMALAQVKRIEDRIDNRPTLSDLRESGAIEQDADLIMFLYRDAYYRKESPYKNVTEVIIAKHRNGPTGSVYVDFEPQYMEFVTRGIEKDFIRKAKEEEASMSKRGRKPKKKSEE